MRYLITGGSGYIGTRLVELLVPPRGHREDRHLRRRPAQGRLPAEDGVRARGRARPRRRPLRAPAREPGRARAPGVHPEPGSRRGPHVRRRRERHAQRAGGGRGGGDRPGARDDLGGGVRRLPGQPGPDHRGPPGARRRSLLVRARQDGVRPDRAALGAPAPGCDHDDRTAVHRLWAQRGQLPGAALEQGARRRGHGQHRVDHPVRARGRRGRGDQPAPARAARGPVQPVAGRADDAPRVRGAARHARDQAAGLALPGARRSCTGGCVCPRRRPAGSTSSSTRGSSRTRS